jgi:hypothetical protein
VGVGFFDFHLVKFLCDLWFCGLPAR